MQGGQHGQSGVSKGERHGGQGQRGDGGQVIEDFVNRLALTQKDLEAIRVIHHPNWPRTEEAPCAQVFRGSNQESPRCTRMRWSP